MSCKRRKKDIKLDPPHATRKDKDTILDKPHAKEEKKTLYFIKLMQQIRNYIRLDKPHAKGKKGC